MIKLFKQNGGWQFVILAAVTLLLWAGAFVHPPQMAAPQGFVPLYELFYRWLVPHARWAVAVGLVLTLVESLMLSNLIYSYKMVTQGTLLPSLLYVVAMALTPGNLTTSPLLLVNLFILIASDQLMVIGAPNLDRGRTAGAAACITLASLSYCPSLLLLIPFIVVYAIYKLYSLYDLLAGLLGLLAPLIVIGCIYLMQNEGEYALFRLLDDWQPLQWQPHPCHWLTIVMDALLVLLTLVILVNFANSADLPPDGHRNGILLAVLLIFGLCAQPFAGLPPIQWALFATPFAFLMNHFLLGGRQRLWLYNLLLILLILCAIAVQY